jgi:hypothetical protein
MRMRCLSLLCPDILISKDNRMTRNNRLVRLLGVVVAITAFGLLSVGCTDSSLDGKVDKSKLPPPFPEGKGPSAGGGMAPGGAPSASGAGAKANVPLN